MKLLVGEIIRLDLQLFDGATDKFVRAFLNDKDGNPYTPASVDLSHANNGLYKHFSLTYPDIPQLTATFKVFDDSGFTQESINHAEALDTFEIDSSITNQTILDKMNQVIDIVTSHDVNSQIIGIVQEQLTLTGIVVEDDVTGVVLDDLILIGVVVDSDSDVLSGTITNETTLIGEIE